MTATPASPARLPLGEREMIVLMALLMSLQAFGIDAMLPALGEMAGEMDAGGNDRQLVISSYFLGAGIGAFFPGAFADRFGRRPVLAVGLVAYVVLSLACALVSDFWSLVAIRVIQGIACAGLSVVPAAIVRDHVGGDRMARLMSLIMMIFLLVPILAPAVGQGIMMIAGWRAIFGAMALMGVIVGIWVWIRLPESLAPENVQEIDPATILKNMGKALSVRGSVGYVLGSALVFGSLFGFLNSSQQLIGEAFGMGDYFALIFGGAVAGMVVSNFTNSRIVERFGARRVGHTALIGFIAISSVMWLSAINGGQGLAEFVVLLSLNMAMLGFIGSNFSAIAMQPFGSIAGAASSAHTALRMGTGSILGGFIGYQYDGTTGPLAVSMLCCGLAGLVFVLFSEKGKLFGRPNAPS